MDERFYLTTAIFYPSAAPPLHSLFEVIGADAIARYQRLLGRDTRFLTGLDEHSAQVERQARERGLEPRALLDPWADAWRAAFDRFEISHDRFIRTTDPDHRRASVEMVRRAQAAGDIYKGTYAGWYCIGDNEFKTDAQVVDGRCPDHPSLELQWLEEENWFFALSNYQAALEQLYRDNPTFCEPEHFRREVLAWLGEGLRDFSISRAGTGWGIPFPDDPGHRIYVWFDALTNYLTGAGFPDDPDLLARYWPADLHVIGKNITRFHCLYWPAMLMSAGLPLPRRVFAHGFMLLRGEKMSKTAGNVLDPDAAAALFGVDGVRYLVLREIPFDRDGEISLEGLVRRYNADLANDLGNLVNRSVSMNARYLDGRLPELAADPPPADRELRATADGAVATYHAAMSGYHLDEALAAIIELTRAVNGYAESQAAWALHRRGELERVGQVLANMAEACRILGHLMAPFTPGSAAALHRQLGVPVPYDKRGAGGPGLDALLAWGGAGGGWHTGAAVPLFPRAELPGAEDGPTEAPR
ncbi:MAG TPA: methionine--tRNA ligase [Candidatus Limnocylindria bacterium]|nr:methionine--tRNA ligase [Candidatus Limnocylindria bacterium]